MIAVRHDTDRLTAGGSCESDRRGGDLQPRTATHLAAMRRRRALLALCGLVGLAAIGVLGSGATAAWWALATAASVAVVYMGLLHRTRRLAAEREFRQILGPSFADMWSPSDIPIVVGMSPDFDAASPVQTVAGSQTGALVRFAFAYVAGWALSPLVFALTLLTGETPRDTTGQRWLANLQGAQERLREQSWRTIAVSAATTASVTAAGTAAVFAGAGTASAATITSSTTVPASAGMIAAAGLSASVTGTPYRIVDGDTLSSIAARFGTTTFALAAANNIADPNLIYAGRVLLIPGGGSGPQTSAATSYTVAKGDTLSAIAARFGTTFSALAAANGIANPNFIYPGEVINLSRQASGATVTTATTPAPPAAPAVAAASASQTAVQVALDQVGKPYQWAGAGPNSFDCSGLVMYAWAQAGVSLPHYSVSQYEDTVRISESDLQPGDLVFYDTGDGAQPGHVTIYVGNGQVVTADSPGTTVRVVPLNWDGTPMGFGRVG